MWTLFYKKQLHKLCCLPVHSDSERLSQKRGSLLIRIDKLKAVLGRLRDLKGIVHEEPLIKPIFELVSNPIKQF